MADHALLQPGGIRSVADALSALSVRAFANAVQHQILQEGTQIVTLNLKMWCRVVGSVRLGQGAYFLSSPRTVQAQIPTCCPVFICNSG
jgi:hypothetical protein